ncbi:MAG: hypothetical protein ACRDFB_02045 [Rhabdochlamydiaceae bacterium]
MLGSYDPETESLLIRLKEEASHSLMNQDDTILIFVLENLEIYSFAISGQSDTEKITVVAEKYDQDKRLSIFIMKEDSIMDAYDLPLAGKKIDDAVVKSISERYNIASFCKLEILEKLTQLAVASSVVFLLRDRELTRGGEYIELVYLLGSDKLSPSKIYFLKNERIPLSEMIVDFLSKYGIKQVPYDDINKLILDVTGIIEKHLHSDA